MESHKNDNEHYDTIFTQYIEICKQAITHNKNNFPYTEIWGARLMALEDGVKVEATVFDDRPKLSYILQLTKNMDIDIVEKKTSPSENTWPFTYQYLQRVIDNPQKYIENPAMLEWGWMKTLFGKV